VGRFRYCQSCGLDFDELAVARPPAEPPTADPAQAEPMQRAALRAQEAMQAPIAATEAQLANASPGSAATLGGLAWLLSALLAGYLAYQQWTFGRLVGGANQYETAAAWNVISAIVTLVFATRLLMRPTRGTLGSSVVWAALSVAWGVYQIANGVTGDVFVLSILAAAAAGVLSFVARQGVAANPTSPAAASAAPGTPAATVGAAQREVPSGRASGSPAALVLLVILSGALAVGVVAVGLASGRLGGGDATALGTAQATPLSATIPTDCAIALQPLYDALTSVDGRLGVGMTYLDYSKAVGDANVAYQRINFAALDGTCVAAAGVPLENALNSYIEAYNVWNKCVQSTSCDQSANTTTLQGFWTSSTNDLDAVKAAWP
jgi:hypothetical protein